MEVTRKGTPYQLRGNQPETDEDAPDFKLNNLTDEPVSLKDFKGEVVLISVIPDIDTRVCSKQTKEFNEIAGQLKGVQLITISNNTKEQQQDWCAGKDVIMEMLHDSESSFGDAYGLYMSGLDVLARSVFVIDKSGKIIHKEIVPEMVDEPDYEKAIEVAISAR